MPASASSPDADSHDGSPSRWLRWLARPLAVAAGRSTSGWQGEVTGVQPLPVDPGRLSADLTLIRAARIHARPGPVRRRRPGMRALP